MGLITNMRSRMQVVMWTILVLFVTSMAIGGLVGGASITDIFGGSPSNLAMLACRPDDRRIVYGANLPMLLKLAKSRNLTIDEAVSAALCSGRQYLDSKNIPNTG